MPSHPILIPATLSDDRAVINLMTQWRNCLRRYHICCRRVNWDNRKASKIEKKRRVERWEVAARIFIIERTILLWTAEVTRHPDIWSSKKAEGHVSTIRTLHDAYHRNRRSMHHLTGTKKDEFLAKRARIVAKIRTMEREWMVAMFHQTHPLDKVPRAMVLHATELRPRKILQQSKILQRNVA